MTAAVTITPAAPVHIVSTCKVNCTGVASNDSTAYNITHVPTEPEVRYYFKLAATGVDDLISNQFAASADGNYEWDSVTIPSAGSWTLTLNAVSDDSVAATTSVTVS